MKKHFYYFLLGVVFTIFLSIGVSAKNTYSTMNNTYNKTLSDSRDITNYVIFSGYDFINKHNDSSINGSSYTGNGTNGRVSEIFKVDYDISSLGGSVKEGDFFTFKIPDGYTATATTQNLIVNNTIVAQLVINPDTGLTTVTFNENAPLMANYNGTLYIPAYIIIKEGENIITHPDGTQTIILYTQEIKNPDDDKGKKIGEILLKSDIRQTSEYAIWNLHINRSLQDFQGKDVLIKDKITSSGNLSTYIPSSFVLREATYNDPTNPYSISYRTGTRIPITTDEDEYYAKKDSQKIAFLNISNGGQEFDLYLGKIADKQSYNLVYHTTHPKDGSSLENKAYILIDDKETLPYESLEGRPATSTDTSSSGIVSIDRSSTMSADVKDRIQITKYDSENGTRLPNVQFSLVKNDSPNINYTLTTDANGIALSEILDAGEYTISEIAAPTGYNISEPIIVNVIYNKPTRVLVPNSKIKTIETRSFTAHKVWVEGAIPRPTITLILQRNGQDYLSAERKQLQNGETSTTWENLPVYSSDGNKYIYSVREAKTEGYKTYYEHTDNSTTITNVDENHIETRSFTAHKIWVGGKYPKPNIELILQRNGEDIPNITRRQLNSGEVIATWNNLLVRDNDGIPYKYTVREEKVSDYIASYEHTDDSTIITNTYSPPFCVKPANTNGLGEKTNFGITDLGRAGETPDAWPMLRKGGWIALESNDKGFVITRTTENQITNPQEGMLIYDTANHCLKLYDGTKWSCFSEPSCPTEPNN